MPKAPNFFAGGSDRPAHLNAGYYVRPTVFARVTSDMTIAREEIFGPVLAILGYESEDDAVTIANDTPYGLYPGRSPGGARPVAQAARRHRAAQQLRLGWRGPFGGYKQSGNGREYGKFGLHEFTEIKGRRRLRRRLSDFQTQTGPTGRRASRCPIDGTLDH